MSYDTSLYTVIGSPKSGKYTFVKKFNENRIDVCRNTNNVIIIFDISNDSILNVIRLLENTKNLVLNIVVLGNKRDLVESTTYREYYQDLMKYVTPNIKYIAISCKTNYNWLSAKKIIYNHFGIGYNCGL